MLLGFMVMGLPLMIAKPDIICITTVDGEIYEESCRYSKENTDGNAYRLRNPEEVSLVEEFNIL